MRKQSFGVDVKWRIPIGSATATAMGPRPVEGSRKLDRYSSSSRYWSIFNGSAGADSTGDDREWLRPLTLLVYNCKCDRRRSTRRAVRPDRRPDGFPMMEIHI